MLVKLVVASEPHDEVRSGEIDMPVATCPLTHQVLLNTPDDGNRYEIIGENWS